MSIAREINDLARVEQINGCFYVVGASHTQRFSGPYKSLAAASAFLDGMVAGAMFAEMRRDEDLASEGY